MSVQQNIADGVTGNRDGVHSAGDIGQKVVKGYHCRMYPGLDLVIQKFADCQQLYAIAELLGKGDIQWRDPGNSLDINILQINFHAVCQCRQDGQFVGRIISFNVQGRIGFGISLSLRLGERRFKCDPLVRNFGQYIVAGAV